MKRTESQNLAFVYAGDAKSIIDICKSAGYKIIGNAKNSITYVTGITENDEVVLANNLLLSNNFDHMNYARLEIALMDKLSMLLRFCDKCSRTGIMQEQRRRTPIYRFKNNAVYAKEIGVQPWEHMLFTGDYVICYIWDTRQVTKVLHINDCKDISKRMLVEANDNNAELVWPRLNNDAERNMVTDAMIRAFHAFYVAVEPSKHPMMTNSTAFDTIVDAISNELHD